MISVIISTYNHYTQLKEAVRSVKIQTYKNTEIIIVDDCSTDETATISSTPDGEFENCIIIHLPQNSRQKFGYPCAGYVRNMGAKIASGKYLAFLDDDDIWLPNKLYVQIKSLDKYDSFMSCTDGYIGRDNTTAIDLNQIDKYAHYNGQHYFDELCNIYERAGKPLFVNREDGFSHIWPKEMIEIHNCIITSSVVMYTELFNILKGFATLKNGEEDWDLWKRALDYTECIYVYMPCFYYHYNNYHGKHD